MNAFSEEGLTANLWKIIITEKNEQSIEMSIIDTSEQITHNSFVNNINLSSDVYRDFKFRIFQFRTFQFRTDVNKQMIKHIVLKTYKKASFIYIKIYFE